MLCKAARKHITALACAASVLAGAAVAHAQDAFRQGLDAYLNGEYQTALEYWQPAAESGDAVAAFNIGVLYAQGLGVEADQAEAVRWYRRSAHAGYANAQFNLGSAYYNGEGTEVNIAQAVSWWETAAAQDHPEAVYNLATLYRRGQGVQQDTRRAVSLFNKAASLGDPRARQALTDMGSRLSETEASGAVETGDGTPAGTDGSAAGGDDDDDSRQPAPQPSRDNPLADENPDHWTVQVFAGTGEKAARQFARDHGLTGRLRIYKAEIDGKTWFKGIYGSFANRAGAQAAQADLAQELSGSDPWIRSFRAIQAEAVGESLGGDAAPAPATGEAQPREQSVSESEGGGSSNADAGMAGEDDEPAVEETGNQASGGIASSGESSTSQAPTSGDQTALREGQKAFSAQNYAAAFEAWRPLAEKGVAEAQYGVGIMYESGWGVDQDYDEAFRWYQGAAQQGHVKAQYNLGVLYRNGQGVSQNDALGLYWIQTAADRGDERAENYLKNLN